MKRTKQIGEACSKCKRTDVEFYPNTAACKTCVKASAHYRKQKQVGEICRNCKRTDVEFYKGCGLTCKECVRLALWRQIRTREGWDARLRRLYGITIHDWERMLAEQGQRCASCDIKLATRAFDGEILWNIDGEPSDVDHCHETNVVRGILCRPCNTSARCDVTPQQLRGVAAYLERWERSLLAGLDLRLA